MFDAWVNKSPSSIRSVQERRRKRSERVYYLLFGNDGNHFPLLVVPFSGSLPIESNQCEADLGSFSNEIESFQTKRAAKELYVFICQYDGPDYDPFLCDPSIVSGRNTGTGGSRE